MMKNLTHMQRSDAAACLQLHMLSTRDARVSSVKTVTLFSVVNPSKQNHILFIWSSQSPYQESSGERFTSHACWSPNIPLHLLYYVYKPIYFYLCHKIVSFLICWVESWCEPAWVYFRGLFWRNALGFSQAAFSTTAAIPLRTGKCHGRADDGGVFFHAAGRAATLRSTVRERRQSIAPPSVKSWLSAEIWCNEPLQLLLPLCDRRFKAL